MTLSEVLFSQWNILFTVLAVLFYFLITKNNDFFEKCGIKTVKGVPVLGNMNKLVFQQESFTGFISRLYKTFPNEKIVGVFEFLKPVLLIRDPEIIKQITIKDFDHFMDHRGQFDENIEPLFARSLFQMKSQKWKEMRSTLSPAFTGSKMRNMFELVNDCAKEFIEGINKEGAGKPFPLEMKDLFTRFSNDVIGTCAFGVKVNSWKDKNNEFFEMGKVVTKFEGLQGFKFFGATSAPALMKFFKISLFDGKTRTFFRELVHGTMKYREDHHVFRPDMINLLMQARKGVLTHADNEKRDESAGFATVEESDIGKSQTMARKWEDDDLTAQCLLFFLAGFDTSSTLMSLMAHELAVNPDIQKKLVQEIDEVRTELNGSALTYEAIQKMKYLDMVVSETLRKWPPANFMDRYCTKPYLLKDSNGNKINMKVGDGVWIPCFAIQNDPKYFPNPEKFDPERFSDENKDKIQPFTYFPFGVGPRNCIGSRFALMECKAIFFYILSSFVIECGKKSEKTIKMKKNSFTMNTENGYWFDLTPRKDII